MQEADGSRRQGTVYPGHIVDKAEWQMIFPMRGVIVPEGVRHFDQSGIRRTVVDVLLFDKAQRELNTPVFNVPVLHTKINRENGEEWDPEPGDMVLVSFVGGNLRDPVVLGYLAPPDNEIQATASQHGRSYRKRSGTSEEIDKAGNRTTIIEGNESVTVNTGDVTVNVVQGKVTVTVKGKTSWTSEGTIEHIGKAGGVAKGNVQADCVCPYTRKVHPMVSATVKSSL